MLLLRMMSWISLRLGRHISRLVLHLIALYFLVFAHDSRRASRAYLPRALGRPLRWLDLYRHFFYFAATIHDRIYLINRRFDLFDISVQGIENIQPLIDTQQGVLLMGAHLGSFEVMRALGLQLPGLNVAMVMHTDNAQKINSMLAAINPQATMDIIPLGQIDSMLQVQQRLEEGVMVGMLADRTLGNEPMVMLNLLGADAALPTGPFRMAALLRRPVVFMVGLYLGANRYQIHFETLADFTDTPRAERELAVKLALQRYVELLNRYTRLAPYNWFNFFDYWQSAAKVSPEKIKQKL